MGIKVAAIVEIGGLKVHVLIEPCVDVPGDWTAFVLELDLVTQGRSPGDALDMAMDAYGLVVAERTCANNMAAPQEDWRRWQAVASSDAGL